MSIYRRVFGIDTYSSDIAHRKMKDIHLEHPSGLILSFGPMTKVGKTLLISPLVGGNKVSIKIRNLSVKTHDESIEILEKLSNSFFFEIDLIHSIPLALEKERSISSSKKTSGKPAELPALTFPEHEYDSAPISLYWYGRSARGMPLLQFLAFYQVLEYYFPTYSQREAGRRLLTVLKDPTFRADRDADIGKVLSAIKLTRSGSFGDERGQLRSTIQECIDPQSLRDFFLESEERKTFFSGKNPLTSVKLSIANKESDLRNDAADLIYEIRCKIVHTKNEYDDEYERKMVLLFSREADLLYNYVELLHFLSKKILISASTRITI